MAPPANLGKYRLIAELGQGGMADVYLAMVAGPTGSGFTKLAVIKRLRPNLVEDPEFVAMLVDEARVSARLNHPNVVQTLEVGFEHEEYYLAMEFLDGQPLHRIQRRAARAGTELPVDLACLIVADVLSGLQHAHELADYDGSPLGIVHRDVNPQNVFVTYDGTVKVVDFGIAKAAGRVAETRQGVVKGKVRYMSPEQALGGEIDRRSDVFAAGLLLWEAVTGKRFWGEMHDLEIIQALVSGDFDPSPRAVDSTIAPELEAMCSRAIAYKAEDRFATAGELRDALEVYLAESAVSARRRLGSFVGGLFTKERADVRGVIERASRAKPDAPSVTLLLAGSQTSQVAQDASSPSGISGVSGVAASIPPMQMSAAPPTMASRRPAVGTVLALLAMMAAFAVLGMELRSTRDAASGGAALASRPTAEVSLSRTVVAWQSGSAKVAVPASSTARSVAPLVPPSRSVAAPTATAAAVAAPSASARPASSAPEVAAPLPKPDVHRPPKATIDMTDPWNRSGESAK